jgi:holliday junction DNA helicase RuvA
MITHLNGTLVKKSPTEIVVDVNGIGYAVMISVSTFEKLPEINSTVHILTHHHVREDTEVLFGFASEDERNLFRLLISVSGIGPKMAQTILSGIQPDDLRRSISQGNINTLTSVPGIGKKTAERMIVELKDKISKIEGGDKITDIPSSPASIRMEALTALVSLGYTREKAEQSIRTVINEVNGEFISVEELIKKALQLSGK